MNKIILEILKLTLETINETMDSLVMDMVVSKYLSTKDLRTVKFVLDKHFDGIDEDYFDKDEFIKLTSEQYYSCEDKTHVFDLVRDKLTGLEYLVIDNYVCNEFECIKDQI